MPGPIGPRGLTGVTPGAGATSSLGCKAFQSDPTLAKLAVGAVPPIARGAPKSGTVKTVQTALYSLGFLKPRAGIDGSFGPGTEAALKAFQASASVRQSGVLDAATLNALDQAGASQIATLKANATPQGSKKGTYRIVADIFDPAKTRLYVLGKNDVVAARYLTSPGKAEFPTRGDHFKIQDVLPRQPRNPPNSSCAAKANPLLRASTTRWGSSSSRSGSTPSTSTEYPRARRPSSATRPRTGACA